MKLPSEPEAALKQLLFGLESFRLHTETACDSIDCEAWTSRGRRCPDCPRDAWDELQAHIEQVSHSPNPDTLDMREIIAQH